MSNISYRKQLLNHAAAWLDDIETTEILADDMGEHSPVMLKEAKDLANELRRMASSNAPKLGDI